MLQKSANAHKTTVQESSGCYPVKEQKQCHVLCTRMDKGIVLLDSDFTKINVQKSVMFLYNNNEIPENEEDSHLQLQHV